MIDIYMLKEKYIHIKQIVEYLFYMNKAIKNIRCRIPQGMQCRLSSNIDPFFKFFTLNSDPFVSSLK